ncbi:MAG: 16S rRNA (cytidine(1402)-2'-O)-methyltransferase [Dehalococcoidia bacterium]
MASPTLSHPLAPGLYVVATPLGNLEDFSPRARKVLRLATIVAAEDTRTSALLVRLSEGHGRMVSLTEHNVAERVELLLTEAQRAVVAVVSDAGTPAISDPGTPLVEAAHAAGVRVVPVPGPSALAASLSAAGFPAVPSTFLGFLPRTKSERTELLQRFAPAATTLVIFENPGRLARTLLEIAETFGDPEVVVCRELTKMHEEVVRGLASALAPRFEGARGECTIVVRTPDVSRDPLADELRAYLAEMKRAGARRSSAAAEAAKRFGVARDEAYGLWDEVEGGR